MNIISANDSLFMSQALLLAKQGMCSTMPNPRVGCVIVNEELVVGEGAHIKSGEPHAEVFALRQAGARAKGATVYVTLEPCAHFGRTPPCADALIQAGVRRVVVAMKDPNPLVSGQGIAKLKSQGIAVEVGVLEIEARALNVGFISRMTRSMPFVRTKIAASLDGGTALTNGQSQWITGEMARQDVQFWRAQSCAILTGIGTVLADNPSMTVREEGLSTQKQGNQPLRVVVDSHLKIPLNAKILLGSPTLIAYASNIGNQATELIPQKYPNVTLVCLPDAYGKVCLKSLLKLLSAREINNVLVEAGAELNGALTTQNLIDEYLLYYAPSLLGSGARGMFELPMFTNLKQRIQLDFVEVNQIGADLRIRAKPQ